MKKTLLITLVAVYLFVATFGCVPLAIATHETLSLIGIDSQIVVLRVDGTGCYTHCAVMVRERVYEPRYVGLHQQSNIDYVNVLDTYNTTEECLDDGYFTPPPKRLLFEVVPELWRLHARNR